MRGVTEPHRSPEILLEVLPDSTDGDLARRSVPPEEFRRRATEIAESVAETADQFRSGLARTLKRSSDSGWLVDSVEVGFQIAVQAEAGVIIAKTTAGTTFSVRLTLKAPQDKE